MFESVLEEHAAKQTRLREDADTSRRTAISSVSGLTESLIDTVNGGVVSVFEDQKRIDSEASALKGKSQKFAKVTGEWVNIVEGFDTQMKAIGDFESWIKRMEFDLNNLTGVMEDVAKKGAVEGEGGGEKGGGE